MEEVSQGSAAGGRSAFWGRALLGLRRLAALLLLASLASVQAHESEQYTLPAGRDFADLGPQLSRSFLAAIQDAVADTNAAIDTALQGGALPAQLLKLQSADQVAGQVWIRIFNTYPTNELLDLGLISPATQARYPGLVTMYRPVESIYDDPLLMLDISKPVRAFFRAGTVSAGGVLFGTDKIIHFINVGRIYHVRYLEAVERGLSEQDASLDAVQATARNPFLSEDGFLGMYTTGIHSNADLAADYAGLKFYRNLTEPVRIGRTLRPPMLQRDGPYWRVGVADPDTVFSAFVSPHWNEVLNPNTYLAYVGQRVRTIIGTRCDDVADWYRDGRGQAHGAAWFAARQSELSTYFGEPYGHELEADDAVSVANICGPARAAAPDSFTPLWWAAALPAGQADALGRSALWWAAAGGDAAEVERLVNRGALLDAPDRDGETPLHAAARQGHTAAVQRLLARGADANRAAGHGVSPLQLAVAGGHLQAAQVLLQSGADPNAQDRFGRSALHDVAQRGHLQMALLLLHHGADATLASRHGSDALQIARRSGHDMLATTLRASAPVVRKLGPADGERVAGRVATTLPAAATDDGNRQAKP
jgi:hypothetical protein